MNQLLEENSKNGWQFIADADARAAGGMHPNAHLWDNQADAVDGLMQTFAVRNKAMQHFSEDVVKIGTPLAQLEDMLVPVYNYHRYQYEAVTKLIGGINYNYSVKGDQNQIKPTILPNAIQLKALEAAMNALSASKKIIVESDLRSHQSPSRQKNIAAVAKKLVSRLSTLCHQCQSPGWGEVGNLYGLECSECRNFIERALRGKVLGCTTCDYREELLSERKFVEPAECEICNP